MTMKGGKEQVGVGKNEGEIPKERNTMEGRREGAGAKAGGRWGE